MSDKNRTLHLEDRINGRDTAEVKNGGLWADTEVIIGYGYHSRLGKSYLDEEISRERNTVPISGVQSVFQHLFGVKGPLAFKTLYDQMGIGLPNDIAAPTFLVPDSPTLDGSATYKQGIYPPGHLVQLFGVGVTGTAENNITVHKVDYRETAIEMDVYTKDGIVDGVMYPFRYTDTELNPTERQKYFGKKIDADNGKTGYYLKRFEMFPDIKHIWKTSDDMDSDTEILVTNDTVTDFTRDDAVNSFVEAHLQITKKDLKEFFNFKLDQPESCRFNTIALYEGRYSEARMAESDQFGDYCNVTLFSKLNIPTEHLSLTKDLEIIYRIYGN